MKSHRCFNFGLVILGKRKTFISEKGGRFSFLSFPGTEGERGCAAEGGASENSEGQHQLNS